MKRLLLLLCLTLMMSILFTGTAIANSSDCSKCHGTIVDSFTVAPPVLQQACNTCHNNPFMTSGHTYPSWTAVYVTDIGWFKSPISVNTSPPAIHSYHDGGNSPAGTSGCSRCHKSVSCNTCHQPVDHKDHGTTQYQSPYFNIAWGTGYGSEPVSCSMSDCHKFYTPGVVTTRTDGTDLCFNCHDTGKAGHTDVAAKHATSFVPNPQLDCTGCHNSDLVTEHEARTDEFGAAYNCFTCHQSIRDDVKAAISAKNAQCDACHSNFDHVVVHQSATIDNKCGTCHQGNLVFEHLSNPKTQKTYDTTTQKTALTCDTCHKSINSKVRYTIDIAGTTDCISCHATGHMLNFVTSVPPEVPLYAGVEWSLPQDASIWANEPWFDQAAMEGAKRVFSTRRTDVTVQQVKDFYNGQMAGYGWSAAIEETVNNTTILKYAVGLRTAVVMIYNSESPKGTGEVAAGYKLDIFYK